MKFMMAAGAYLLLSLLAVAASAAEAKLQVVDLTTESPISDVVITVTVSNMSYGTSTYKLMTDVDGRASVYHPGMGGSSCQVTTIAYELSKQGYQFSHPDGYAPCGPIGYALRILGTTAPKLISVSAANYKRFLASDVIVATFGENLATATEAATLPLKTTLAGRRVLIKDSKGEEKAAKLLFVSPSQINYLLPAELAEGAGTARLVDEGGAQIKLGFITINDIAPGIFSANADGQGPPAAIITRVKPGNVQSYESVARFDEVQNKFVPAEIDLGPENEIVVLSLFGTGWRNARSAGAAFGGRSVVAEYVGRQPTIEGLDQVNLRLPRDLSGRGEVNVVLRLIGANGVPVLTNVLLLKFK